MKRHRPRLIRSRITDYVTLQRGSAYGGVLSNFSG
ncbi:fimbrial protein, partial [Escherichia sp. TWPC-MK]